jgi:site-specific recombinase XerD
MGRKYNLEARIESNRPPVSAGRLDQRLAGLALARGGRACRGLPPVHPHMLRHSCGFSLANGGYDLRLIQDYLGHRDPKHTVHYTRVAAGRFEGLWR